LNADFGGEVGANPQEGFAPRGDEHRRSAWFTPSLAPPKSAGAFSAPLFRRAKRGGAKESGSF